MLRAEGLKVRAGRRTLVERLGFELQAGTITVMLGPNGAGKTSLLRTLAGERAPDGGTIQIDGRSIAELDGGELATCRAVLSQQLALEFPFTVAEIVRMGCAPYPGQLQADILQAALRRIGLMEAAGRVYTALSGGEQQRVHLARIDAQASPRLDAGRSFILLLDEPATHLDPAHQLELAQWMRGMAGRGAAVLTILHDFQLAASLADRVILLDGKGGAQTGTAAALLNPETLSPVFGIPVACARAGNGAQVLYTATTAPGTGL